MKVHGLSGERVKLKIKGEKFTGHITEVRVEQDTIGPAGEALLAHGPMVVTLAIVLDRA